MAKTMTRERRLTDEQLHDLLQLVKDADSIELKLTVPVKEHRHVISSLELDPLDAQIRQVFFFDTPDLSLNKSGVVVRARRVQGRDDDTVVKLRPVVPSELPARLRRSPAFGVEVDAMPGGYVCSASFKGAVAAGTMKAVAAGTKPIKSLFDTDQKKFYKTYAPEGLGIDQLSILGPLTVLKLKFKPKELKRKMVAELWFYPNGSRILELSTKCLPTEGLETALETRLYLSNKGVDLSAEQQTKTKTALDFFVKAGAKGAAD